jgi:uncharacterized protein (UPF0332 family)
MTSRGELIQYRVARAKESFAATKDLIANGYYNDAASRMYYACFYILLAYICAKQLKAETHKRVQIVFHELIKTGSIDKKFSKLYSKLFNRRFESEHAEFANYAIADVKPLISEVEEFIITVEKLIISTITNA